MIFSNNIIIIIDSSRTKRTVFWDNSEFCPIGLYSFNKLNTFWSWSALNCRTWKCLYIKYIMRIKVIFPYSAVQINHTQTLISSRSHSRCVSHPQMKKLSPIISWRPQWPTLHTHTHTRVCLTWLMWRSRFRLALIIHLYGTSHTAKHYLVIFWKNLLNRFHLSRTI